MDTAAHLGLISAKQDETHTSIHQNPPSAEQADAILPSDNDKLVKNRPAPTVIRWRDAERGNMKDERIRKIILQEKQNKGFTWCEIARRTGIAQSTICNYALGYRNTSLGVVCAILDVLGLELTARRKGK